MVGPWHVITLDYNHLIHEIGGGDPSGIDIHLHIRVWIIEHFNELPTWLGLHDGIKLEDVAADIVAAGDKENLAVVHYGFRNPAHAALFKLRWWHS